MSHFDPSPPHSAQSLSANPAPQKLFTFKSGGWVLLLAGFMSLFAAALVLYPVYTTGGFHRSIGDGHNIDTYGFDLSNLEIPRSQLTPAVAKDQIRAIPQSLVETITPDQVALIAKNEHIRFLVPNDEIIGVEINGEARAYPLRVLNLHELVNDTLGGTPLAVSYSPLSDSALVFDRRIDGPNTAPVELGISGLLVDSNSVFFDRRGDARQESLWPQLAMHAISGPAAGGGGKPLTLIPYELTTWADWTHKHPSTRVLQGLRTHKAEYGSEPYNTYHATNELKYPASPTWPFSKYRNKTRILVTSADREHWQARLPASSAPGDPYRIYAYGFAWYAQHPDDTDYSAFK